MADPEERRRKPIDWLKDVLLPVAGLVLAVMGFVANADANRRQQAEAQAAREQKYLEYFLQNYSEQSPVKQASAFALLKYMNPSVRQDLVYGLSANTDLSREAWRVLVGLPDVKLNFSDANRYRIEIYHGAAQAQAAKRLAAQLKDAGFEGPVVVEQKIPAFWDRYGWGEGNEVRFDPDEDARAMQYLFRFLDARNPELRLRASAVGDKSRPDSVAVHLPPSRP